MQISSFSSSKNFNQKVHSRNNNPLKTPFLHFRRSLIKPFFCKIHSVLHQTDRFCVINPYDSPCNSTTFTPQNDRNCSANRPLLHPILHTFLAHFLSRCSKPSHPQQLTIARSKFTKNRPKNLFLIFRRFSAS